MPLRIRTPLLANAYTAPTIGSTSATVDLDFINGVYQVSGSLVALSAALASTGSLTTDANGLICDGSTKFNLTGTALTNALGRGVLVVEVAAGTDNHYIFGEIGTDSFANDVMVGVETTTSDFVFARVQNSGGETKSYDTVPFSTSTTYRAATYLNGTAATFKAAWNGAHYWSPGLGLSSSPTDVYIGCGKNFGAFNLTGSVRRVFFVPQTADTPQSQLEAISVVGATTAPAPTVNTLSPGSGALTIGGQTAFYTASSNKIVRNDDLTQANWSGFNAPTASTSAVALGDGTTMFKIQATNTVATWFDNYLALSASQQVTYEYYVKNGNTGFTGFDWALQGVSDTTVIFNLTTGAIVSGSDNIAGIGGSARIDATNQTGIYRIAVTVPTGAGGNFTGAPFVTRGTGIADAVSGDNHYLARPVLTIGTAATLPLTITTTGNTLSPGSGSLTFTGQAPQLSMKLSPGTGAITITGQAARTALGLNPGTSALTIAGQAVLIARGLNPGTQALAITGQSPQLTMNLNPGTGSLAITGQQAVLGGLVSISPGTGTLTITGQLATVSIVAGSNFLFPGSGVLTINGQAPLLSGIRSLKSPTVRVRYLS